MLLSLIGRIMEYLDDLGLFTFLAIFSKIPYKNFQLKFCKEFILL
jgi:hypothetical protein